MGLLGKIPHPENTTAIGWPWTEESSSSIYSHKKIWPKISIITPNFNQEKYIEETIRSILLQNYPNLEFIIIDGGSTDNSIKIIEKYSKWLTYWTSEKDRGQADAINKGLKHCTGVIFNWINSDDFLEKDGLFYISSSFSPKIDAFAFSVRNFGESQSFIHNQRKVNYSDMLLSSANFHQPGVWLALEKVKKIGELPQDYHYCFDGDFYIRYLSQFPKVKYSKKIVVNFRLHEGSKTYSSPIKMDSEFSKIRQNLLKTKFPEIRVHFQKKIETKTWNKVITKIFDSSQLSQSDKIFIVFRLFFTKNYAKLNRFFLGSIRKIILDQK